MAEADKDKKISAVNITAIISAAAALMAAIFGGIDKCPKNQPPVARITASRQEGTVPFEVAFNGAKSSDPEGSDLKFTWMIDNEIKSDKTIYRHVFVQPGEYSVVLKVEDSGKLRHQDSVIIKALPGQQQTAPSVPDAALSQEKKFANDMEPLLVAVESPSKHDQEDLSANVQPGTAEGSNSLQSAVPRPQPPADFQEKPAENLVVPYSVDPAAMTAAHNQWRAKAGVPALKWSNKLAAAAQAWTDHLKNTSNCAPLNSNKGFGENIYQLGALVYSDGRRELTEKTPQNVTETWSRSSAYSNMVDEKFAELGCAKSVCEDKSQVWMCYYRN